MEKEEHFAYKVVVLGDAGAGKTSLTLRYTDNTYNDKLRCTVGVDFRSKAIDVDGIRVKLNIFDTAGQEAYRSIVKTYYCGVDAALFCYAINNRQSFAQVDSWLREFYNNSDSINCLKILVGTKSDCESQRQISKEQAIQLMQRESFLFQFETSALQNLQVSQVFEQIARNLLLKTFRTKKTTQEQQSNKKELTQMLSQPQEDHSGSCC